MSKVAIISDTHWGARNSSLIFLEYMSWWWENEFIHYCKENKIKEVIVAGDFFDSRTNLNTRMLKYVNKFIKQIEDEGIFLHMIPGNHDLFYRNSNDIDSLSAIDRSPNVIVYREAQDVNIRDNLFFMCPWINQNNYESTLVAMKESKAKHMIGHLEIAGRKMYKHSSAEHGMEADIFKQFDHVYSGHFHHPSTVGNLTYLGSPFHITWQDHGDKRGFMVFDTEDASHEYVENTHCLFERIYYDDTEDSYTEMAVDHLENKFVELVVVKKDSEAELAHFVGKIREVNTWSFEVIDRTELELTGDEEVDAESLKHDTMTLTKSYMKEVVDEKEMARTVLALETVYDIAKEAQFAGEGV